MLPPKNKAKLPPSNTKKNSNKLQIYNLFTTNYKPTTSNVSFTTYLLKRSVGKPDKIISILDKL